MFWLCKKNLDGLWLWNVLFWLAFSLFLFLLSSMSTHLSARMSMHTNIYFETQKKSVHSKLCLFIGETDSFLIMDCCSKQPVSYRKETLCILKIIIFWTKATHHNDEEINAKLACILIKYFYFSIYKTCIKTLQLHHGHEWMPKKSPKWKPQFTFKCDHRLSVN